MFPILAVGVTMEINWSSRWLQKMVGTGSEVGIAGKAVHTEERLGRSLQHVVAGVS